MKSKVAIVRCGSYNTEEVSKAVSRGLELMGGAESFVKQGEKILLKVNLLVGEVPEKCVNTHPAVFRAVAELFATKVLSYNMAIPPVSVHRLLPLRSQELPTWLKN